jgi:acyl-coenzyme A synthetase/AMP-(fatty) acid ligase
MSGRFNFARDVFDAHAATDPARLALLVVDEAGGEERHAFGELSERSRRLAHALLARGLHPGQTVLLLLPRRAEWWEALLACLRAGLVANPATTQLTERDLASRLPAAEVAAVLTDADLAPRVDAALARAERSVVLKLVTDGEAASAADVLARSPAAPPGGVPWTPWAALGADDVPGEWIATETTPDTPALLFFTSGTTGAPKMALHTQESCGRGHRTTGELWLGLNPTDLHWNLSDTGWAKAAWSSFFAPWICGAAVFAHHAARFSPRATLELLARHPVTTLCGAPTNYRMLIREDLSAFRFPHLRSCTAAGEPINPEVLAVWQRATGVPIRDGYGQTETVLCIGNLPGAELRPGSMGRPAPGWEIELLDEHGASVPPGAEGEIAIRCRPRRPLGLFAGYWKDAERTAAVFRGDFYCTGDRATRDEDGYVWFVGRADDVIKSAGYRIGPFEVESALLEHPDVVESAVVGVPDELRGQRVKAFVVLAPAAAARVGLAADAADAADAAGETVPPDRCAAARLALVAELQRFVQERTAPYKYPRDIEFMPALPKTVSGKIRRAELREAGRDGSPFPTEA